MDQAYKDRNKKIIADKILARQPILNRSQKTVGYELLFRASRDSKEFDHTVNGKFATLTVINSLISVGLENGFLRPSRPSEKTNKATYITLCFGVIHVDFFNQLVGRRVASALSVPRD
jgi:hypothetical protein